MNPQTPGACQGCNHSAAPIARPGLYAPGANETDVPVENIYHRSTGATTTDMTPYVVIGGMLLAVVMLGYTVHALGKSNKRLGIA